MEKRDGKANRPFCSRVMKERQVVMKERQVVMKERAIPGPCNCCPRGPRIQYYSMGLAIWIEKDKRYPVTDRYIDRYIPRRVGHCANQCGARSGSPQLLLIVLVIVLV